MFLSVIIPVNKEEKNIRTTVSELTKIKKKKKKKNQVFIDDFSTKNKKQKKNEWLIFGISYSKYVTTPVFLCVISLTIFLILSIHYDIIFNNS